MGLLNNLRLMINSEKVFEKMERENPPRNGKEHLMALGAMFQYNEPKMTLSSTSKPTNIQKFILEPNWGIVDEVSAKATLDSLSNLESNQEIDIKYILKNDWSVSEELVEETENYQITKESDLMMEFVSRTNAFGLTELVSLLFKDAKLAITYRDLLDLDNIHAWDIERFAGLARQTYTAGYITEDECYRYLQEAEDLAKEHYSNWKQYALGYILGRYYLFKKDNSEQFVNSAARLLHDENSVWNQFPL